MTQAERRLACPVSLPLNKKSERELAQWEFREFRAAYSGLLSWRTLLDPIGALKRFEDRIEVVRVIGEYRVNKLFTAAETLRKDGRKRLAEGPRWSAKLRQNCASEVAKHRSR